MAEEEKEDTCDLHVQEMVKCSAMRWDLLKELLPDLQSSQTNCSLKIVKEGLELNGTSEAVKQARLDISQKVFSFKSQPIKHQMVRLLQSERSQQRIQELFLKAGVQAVLSMRDGQLWLTAADSHQNTEASSILEMKTHRCEIEVEDFHQEFLHSADCKQFIEDLEHKYAVSIEKGTSTLVIEVLGDCLEEVKKQVEDKLEENAQCSDDIPLTEEQWKLLKAHHQAETEAFGRKGSGVTLERSRNGNGIIKVSGDVKHVEATKTELKIFLLRIVHRESNYRIAGLYRHMNEGSGKLVIHAIQNLYKSYISISEMDRDETSTDIKELEEANDTRSDDRGDEELEEADDTRSDDRGDEELEEADDTRSDDRGDEELEETDDTRSDDRGDEVMVVASGVKLEVVCGDITTFKADVLVNTLAGNDPQLTNCGVICKAFCSVGGKKVQELYDTAKSDRTTVTVTSACGNLPCQHVFHMRLHRLQNDNYQPLEDKIYSCVKNASERHADTIAFPPTGCGNLHYNLQTVLQCFDRAIKKHEKDGSCSISKVFVCVYDSDQYDNIQQNLRLLQANSTEAADNSDDGTSEETSAKVALIVEQGDLTTFKVDVLVNTPADMHKDLTKCGQVCRAFCNTGGAKMQELFDKVFNDNDDLMVTETCGKLQGSHVLHMRIPADKNVSYQKLEDHIYRCLQKASELQATSIAFPTVGCGKLGYQPTSVAQCFQQAVNRHMSDRSCSLLKVIVVAYKQDKIHQQFSQTLAVPKNQHSSSGKKQLLIVSTPPTTRPSTKVTRPVVIQSTTSFRICALNQLDLDNTEKEIAQIVEEYSTCETVPIKYLAMLTKDDLEDIMSLNCEKVNVSVDTLMNCITVEGEKVAVTKTVAAVSKKVQAIEERPNFVEKARGRDGYLAHIANQPVNLPDYWTSVKGLEDGRIFRVQANPNIVMAIKNMVERTWMQALVGLGLDAQGLTHNNINVTSVEQIENLPLHTVYEQKKKHFCRRASKGSFTKVSSHQDEKDVLTAMLGISELDNLLIPEINEHFLFHGAPKQVIDSLLQQGIDFRLASRAMFGKGAYFCESSTKADQYTDQSDKRNKGPHTMFLCKVVLGRSYIAKKPEDMKRPPCLSHCTEACKHGPSEFYDSVMGTHRDNGSRLLFREFVIYGEGQIYPAFLITYDRI